LYAYFLTCKCVANENIETSCQEIPITWNNGGYNDIYSEYLWPKNKNDDKEKHSPS
jgi:hypothetical protein